MTLVKIPLKFPTVMAIEGRHYSVEEAASKCSGASKAPIHYLLLRCSMRPGKHWAFLAYETEELGFPSWKIVNPLEDELDGVYFVSEEVGTDRSLVFLASDARPQ